MKKRLLNQLIVSLLAIPVILSTVAHGITATATSVSDNSIEETILEDTTSKAVQTDIEPTVPDEPLNEYNHCRNYVASQMASRIEQGYQFINIDLPDNSTWGYNQTFARYELFPLLNQTRMTSSNWWMTDNDGTRVLYFPSDPAKTPISVSQRYEYDVELEKVAMQRAAELLFRYEHTRPNSIMFAEAYEEVDSNPYSYASNYNELICFAPMKNAYGINLGTSAADIVYGFMEEYAYGPGGQEHRRVILSNELYRIGIGVVETEDGHRFVAIEVSEDTYAYDAALLYGNSIPLASMDAAPAVDGYQDTNVEIAVNKDGCLRNTMGGQLEPLVKSQLAICDEKTYAITIKPGETLTLADMWFGTSNHPYWGLCQGDDNLFFKNGWTSGNSSIATVQNGVITAVSAGEAIITCKDDDGCTIGSIKIVVPAPKLVSATATYDKATATVGDIIYGSNITITSKYDYGADKVKKLSEYGAYSFKVDKEGENTFTFNHPDAPSGVSIPVTFKVTGTKASTTAPTTPTTPITPTTPTTPITPTTPTQPTNPVIYSQRITVDKKLQKTVTVKYKTIKKSSKTYKIGAKVITSGGVGHGLLSYKVTKYPKNAKKYITVDKKGKITLKKGAKKGTYKVKITAGAVKNQFSKTTKTVTIVVK